MDSKPKVYKIAELTSKVKTILQNALGSLWIEGEISNLKIPTSGHIYFDLKDKSSQIACVFFKNNQAKVKYQPKDGDHVLLFGRISIYEKSGQYQIITEDMEPRGRGVLQKAFEDLKKKLSEEGLFSKTKKPIPKYPWRIGVITSLTGAAIHDIINVTKRRNPKVSILVYPVKAQGDGSAEEIVEAIKCMNQYSEVDVIIVGRGGGSIEDLWAFNTEIVARAISTSELPIVSAVGHEVDVTIADYVADVRAATPSVAAELVVPKLYDISKSIQSLTTQILSWMQRKISNHKDWLRKLGKRRFFRHPSILLEPKMQKFDYLIQGLRRASPEKYINQQKENLIKFDQRLKNIKIRIDERILERDRTASLKRRVIWTCVILILISILIYVYINM